MRVLGVVGALVVCCGIASGANAQQRATGSRNLPLDHWAYEYLRRLTDRGYLPQLDPLVQPYRRLDVARGLVALDADSLPEPLADWVRMLDEEFAAEVGTLSGREGRPWGFEAQGGARGSTSRRLDPLRPVGDGKVWPWARGGAWAEAGPIAAESRVLTDRQLRDAPDGVDQGGYPFADNTYISATLPVGNVILGRLARNWGPMGTTGLMVSDVPIPYPQVGLELTAGRFTLRWFTAELDTLWKADTLAYRHLVAHRVDYATRDLVVSLGESSVYAAPDGGLRLRYLNPLEVLYFDAHHPPYDLVSQNTTVDGQLWLRRGGVVLYAEGLLDDIDVNPDSQPAEPPLYAVRIGARVTSLAPWIEPGVEYQRVSAWTYRSNHIVDRYSYLNRGLGANFSDYERFSLWADLYPPVPGLRLTPGLVLQRKGVGDFRDPNPGDTYAGQPAMFLGVVERTLRAAFRGRYQPRRFFWISWDLGPNDVHNVAHQLGVNGSAFHAVGELGFQLEFP